jgi:hypothetical protein
MPGNISQEQIPYQLLSNIEVLESDADQKKRKDQLLKAYQHNRINYSKAIIVFETKDGCREVLASIWEVTDNYVLLKGGINIPIPCIHKVVIEVSTSI